MNNQRILRLLRLILAGITFISLCLIFLESICDPDFFWHLSTGRWIVEHLSLPTYDPFNYTTPALLSSREHFILTSYWLSQILYYGIYYVSNWNGFILSRFIILGIIIYFIYKRARGSDMTILFSIMAVTMIVFSQIYPLERPQVFSFLFFAILLYLLEYLREACSEQRVADSEIQTTSYTLYAKRYTLFFAPYTLYAKRYAMLPLLMLFWANMHGGYILGQGVILVYLLSEGLKFLHPSLRPMEKSSYKRFLIIGVTGILSALINPNTYSAITEMWNVSFLDIANIREYQSTITIFKVYYALSIPFYWLLLLVAGVSLLYRIKKKRFEVQDVVMFAGLGYFSFTQVRYIAFFLIWAAPFIALSLTTATGKGEGGDKVTPLHPPLFKGGKEGGYLKYICVLLSLFIIAIFIIKKFDNVKNVTNFKTGQWIGNEYPEDAVRFIIDNDIKGNMYNYCEWGGYLIWRFYPGEKVFADTRNLYRLQYSQDMHILSAAIKPEVKGMPYYKAILESYGVRYMVIPLFSLAGEMLPIAAETIRDKEWIPVFFKDNTMVFVRDTNENHEVIHAHSIPKDIFVSKLFRMLDEKIKESPRDFRLYLTRGDLYCYVQWKFKEARREYEKVLEINPFNSIARERLVFLNSKMQSEF